MKTVKVALSVPKDLLQLIDQLAQSLGVSRSKLFSEGAKIISKRYEQEMVARKYDEVFSDPEVQADQKAIAEDFMSIVSDIL
jgi:metal-responsive CopG/Arc/MetJ family transcriptional regulator